jgi:competence CoiA-like predicted nuclease
MKDEQLTIKQAIKVVKITREQKEIENKIVRIQRYPEPKRESTKDKRLFRIFEMILTLNVLEHQKRIILSEPLPQFEKGVLVTREGKIKPPVQVDNFLEEFKKA